MELLLFMSEEWLFGVVFGVLDAKNEFEVILRGVLLHHIKKDVWHNAINTVYNALYKIAYTMLLYFTFSD